MEDTIELEDINEVMKLFDKREKGEIICIGSVTEITQGSDKAKIKMVITAKQDNILVKCVEMMGEVNLLLPNVDEYKTVNIQRQEVIDSVSQKVEKRKTELFSTFEKKGFKVLFGMWSS